MSTEHSFSFICPHPSAADKGTHGNKEKTGAETPCNGTITRRATPPPHDLGQGTAPQFTYLNDEYDVAKLQGWCHS